MVNRIQILKIGTLFLICGPIIPALARPPVDLSQFETPKGQGRLGSATRPLTDKDLVFTDNLSKKSEALKDIYEFKIDVIGRSEPNRKAKPLLKFQKTYRVRFFRESQDKKWIAVELLNGSKKAWVPKASVQPVESTQSSEY